jgi:hypothetical protein
MNKQDDIQVDSGEPRKQEPVFERWWWFDLPAGDKLGGGQENFDLTAPRSSFGHEESY